MPKIILVGECDSLDHVALLMHDVILALHQLCDGSLSGNRHDFANAGASLYFEIAQEETSNAEN